VQPVTAKKPFFGWFIVIASIVTFGIAVGVPYYNLPFFYDYFQKSYGWRLDQITLGFPLAALLTIWVGPILIPRFSPRKLILAGTAATAVALCGFGSISKVTARTLSGAEWRPWKQNAAPNLNLDRSKHARTNAATPSASGLFTNWLPT
jgi:nitrate/nitrite transporter NarK